MAMASAAENAQKWVDRTSAATSAYVSGIRRTDVNPMERAAANEAGYLAGVQQAVADGRYKAGLLRTTKEFWAQRCIDLGAQRIGTGVTAAKGKMTAFFDQFLPFLASNLAQVKAMPNQTYEQRKARMNTMSDLNHGFRRRS